MFSVNAHTMSYSNASLDVRIEALLDVGTRSEFGPSDASSAVRAARGSIAGRPVWIAGTDASRSRGAIGVAEASLLCDVFVAARAETAPLCLLVDSGGAKVDEGLAALGAFRRLFREALLTRLAGVPMFALLGRSCFGGASMLATLCNSRIYSERTLLGASGPAVIQALAGREHLDAGDATAVQALMGGEARAALGGDEILCADELQAFRNHAQQLTSMTTPHPVNIRAQHERLAQRLGAESATPRSDEAIGRMRQLAPSGYRCTARGDVVRAAAADPHGGTAFIGVLSGESIGAATSWMLADELIDLHVTRPGTPVILLLDATGQSATRRDEQLLLSAYITHFALTAAWVAARNHRILLWIPGQAAGAVYVAFAAPAESVSALPSAQLRILPHAAAAQIVRNAPAQSNDADTWIRTGVVDALLDSRLASYAAAPESR